MYRVYTNEEPVGARVNTAEDAWRLLRSKRIVDVPRIDVVLEVDGEEIEFCAATWYSVIYTGMDDIFNLTDDEVDRGLAMIEALRRTYPAERSASELSVIGCRDLVIRNRTEKIEDEWN